MADIIELFLVGQGLLLVSFIVMVGLFLLLLYVRINFGSGIGGSYNDCVMCNLMTTQGREGRPGAGSPQDPADHQHLQWASALRPETGEDGLETNSEIRLITGQPSLHWQQ